MSGARRLYADGAWARGARRFRLRWWRRARRLPSAPRRAAAARPASARELRPRLDAVAAPRTRALAYLDRLDPRVEG